MSIIKFRKIRERFPNRKVRIVRTEQLWGQAIKLFQITPYRTSTISEHSTIPVPDSL